MERPSLPAPLTKRVTKLTEGISTNMPGGISVVRFGKVRKPLTRTGQVQTIVDFARNALDCLHLLAGNYRQGPTGPQVGPRGLPRRPCGPTTGPKGRA